MFVSCTQTPYYIYWHHIFFVVSNAFPFIHTCMQFIGTILAGTIVTCINWALWPISDNPPNRRDKFYKRKNRGLREGMEIVVYSFPSLCIFSSSWFHFFFLWNCLFYLLLIPILLSSYSSLRRLIVVLEASTWRVAAQPSLPTLLIFPAHYCFIETLFMVLDY